MTTHASTLPGDKAPPRRAVRSGHERRSRPRPGWVKSLSHFALPTFSIAVFLALYQVLGEVGVLDRRYLPSLLDITDALGRMVMSGALWQSVAGTWSAAAAGYFVGILIAVPLGLLAGRNPVFQYAARPIVEFLRPLPSVAMIPLVVLLWGPSGLSKAFLACFTTIWPLFIQTTSSVRDAHPTTIETGRSFGMNRFDVLTRIVLPSALPSIATAIRIQASIALLVTITAEVALGGGGGLGILVFQLDQTANYAAMYALLVFIGIQGMCLSSGLAALERLVMPWHIAHRQEHE